RSRELELGQVARHRPGPRRDDSDDRAVEACRVDPQGTEVGAGAGALGAGAEGGPGAGAEVGLVHAREILRAVVGAVLILVPAATAVLVALSLRVGATSTLVVAYVAWVANLALVTQ